MLENEACGARDFERVVVAPLFFILLVGAEYVARLEFLWEALRIVAAALLVSVFFAWYIRSAGLVVVLSQRRRRVLTILLFTICWVAAFVLFLVILPLALWYASVLIRILS